MNCNQCLEATLCDLKGELEHPLRKALHNHINECKACRREYDELKWLQNGIKGIGSLIESAHISSKLLYDYAVFNEELGDDTIRFINHHLEQCSDCNRDLKIIRDLSSINLASADQELIAREHVKGFWRGISYRRSLLAYSLGGISIIMIAALVIYFSILHPPASPSIYFIKENAIRSPKYKVIELTPMQTMRGPSEEIFTPAHISKSSRKKFALKINLSSIDEDTTYRIKISTEEGETLWEANIEEKFLSSGNLLLFFEKERFNLGLYYIEIFEHSPEGYESLLLLTAFRITQ